MRPSAWLDRLFPSPRWDEVVFWAIDLETSGLRPQADRIISVAAVPIRDGVIRYGERYVTLVRPPDLERLPTEGLRAHHLLPSDLAAAPPIDDILPELDRRLREGVLLLHFRKVDLGFLQEAYRAAARPWPSPQGFDTVELLLKLHRRRHFFHPHPTPAITSLAAARQELGLPAHRNHDALADAVATAELFLLLRAKLDLCTLRSLR